MPVALFSDTTLPLDAKYYGFTDLNSSTNPEWDIVWSFTYALTGFDTGQHGFCTFLTTTPFLSAGIPGWYLGYLAHGLVGNTFLVTEDLEVLLDETNDPLEYESNEPSGLLSGIPVAGIFAVAFDSTGYFALSDSDGANPGVGLNKVIKNSLIVRDYRNQVIFNRPLSAMNPNFVFFSQQKYYQTLRFRLINAGSRLVIEFKPYLSNSFELLTAINVTSGFTQAVSSNVYVGFSYCSPLSSLIIEPSTMYLKNFSVQAISAAPTYEIVPTTSIRPTNLTYTSISGVRNLI